MKKRKLHNILSKDGLWFALYYFLRLTYLDRLVPDEPYLRLKYRCYTGQTLHLNPPRTFNEKLQWLKLHNHNPLYTKLVDKYEVKKWVAGIIGEEYVIPTLGVWDKTEDIDWDGLPNQFVLKCTHDSGGLVICKDKTQLDKNAATEKLKKSLAFDYYLAGREWPYKNVPRRIIAEKYIEDSQGELNAYKVFSFNGEPKMTQVDYNRFKGHLRNLYNTDWERINATICYPADPNREIERPKVLDELKKLSEKLSLGVPHLRTDFYIVDNKIYFGELTFFHGSGMEEIKPLEFDRQLGDWKELSTEVIGGGKIHVYNKGNIYICVRYVQRPMSDLPDYKFFCFDGEPKALFVATGRQVREEPYFDFFDMDYNHLDIKSGHPQAPAPPTKPSQFEKMKELATSLSKGFCHVRVDFYEVNGKVYFGEMTFYHHTGMVNFEPDKWNGIFGNWINLPKDN